MHARSREFVALFRTDAIWTTGGKKLIGRDGIAAFTRQVLFIRPDVAAVKVRQLYTSTDGVPREDEGRARRCSSCPKRRAGGG